MKIRQGFVSNSSSSSFCLYGVALELDDMKQFVTEEVDLDGEDWASEVYWHDVEKNIKKIFGEDYSFYWDEECCESFYIGRELRSLKDDETGKQFKESVENKIGKIFGQDYTCKIHNEEV